MKINISSETSGQEIQEIIITQLSNSSLNIKASPEEIKLQVQNKEGKWIDFDIAKIKFIFSR
jgi:ribose 5-phosphate isomerase RpiB